MSNFSIKVRYLKHQCYQVNYVIEFGMTYFKFNRKCEITVLKNIFLLIIYNRQKWLAGPFSYLKLERIVHAAFSLDVHRIRVLLCLCMEADAKYIFKNYSCKQ